MKVAIEGCCHGELDNIYRSVAALEQKNGYKVDVLLICGDFQAMRNEADMETMACPPKYRALHDFHKYYTGEKKAPVLTIVIGGNHEASNYMWELYHGGWLAPNIYFLGHAGCVQLDGMRIAGASGIFNHHHFGLGHFESPPYDNSTMRSIYHVREFCVRKLSLLSSPTLFMSHDWPQSIEQHGDLTFLLKRKKHFAADIASGQLGSPPMMGLLRTLKPAWWFSAHLHVKFEGSIRHEHESGSEKLEKLEKVQEVQVKNPGEIMIEEDDIEMEGQPAAAKTPREIMIDVADVVGVAEEGVLKNPDEILIDQEKDVGVGMVEAALQLDLTAPELAPELTANATSQREPQHAPPARNPDEILLSDEEDIVPPPAPPSQDLQSSTMHPSQASSSTHVSSQIKTPQLTHTRARAKGYSETKFLALDKCLPHRLFLEVIDVPLPSSSGACSPPKRSRSPAAHTPTTPKLTFDPEWLAITRAFNPWLSRAHYQRPFPPEEEARAMVAKELEWVKENVLKAEGEAGRMEVEACQTFVMTAPGPGAKGMGGGRVQQPPYYPNPQTDAFCRMLGIENRMTPTGRAARSANTHARVDISSSQNVGSTPSQSSSSYLLSSNNVGS